MVGVRRGRCQPCQRATALTATGLPCNVYGVTKRQQAVYLRKRVY